MMTTREISSKLQRKDMQEYKFTEIFKLKDLLDEAGVPYQFFDRCFPLNEGRFINYQICYPCKCDERVCSAIQSNNSYGREQDLIEIMGLLTPEEEKFDMVAGYLTAEDVAGRIIKHWQGVKNEAHR